MAKKRQFLINHHTSGLDNMPLSGDVRLGEIIVRHNDVKPEILTLKDNGEFATFIDKGAVSGMIATVETNLGGIIEALDAKLDKYALSADTAAQIKAVDDKLADYALSGDTAEQIAAVDSKFAKYALSADTAAQIKAVDTKVDALDSELDSAISALTEAINTKVAAAYIFKGTVENFSDLPEDLTKKETGYVYNVEKANGNYPAGTNYAWDGAKWDALGGMVDLTVFATSADTAAQIKAVDTKVDTLSSNLENNYALSAHTHAAIVAVDAKFAQYDLSADTAEQIAAVDSKFAKYALSADTAEQIAAVDTKVDNVDAKLADYALSGDTAEQIAAVDSKFAKYALSADTHNAIAAVDAKFANYATSADTHAAIKAVNTGLENLGSRVDALEGFSANTAVQTVTITGISGVAYEKQGTHLTIDFSEAIIDGGTF